MTYTIGLVGARRGSSLVQPFAAFPEARLSAVCDLDPKHLADSGQAFDIADDRLYTDYDAMLASDVNIVVVGTPIQFHAEQAIKAMEAGKHVLSEVTAAYKLEDLQRIIDTAQRTGRIYMMAENNCYLHYIRQWKEWMAQGRIGDIFYAECEYIHDVEHLMLDEKSGESFWRLNRPPIYYCTHSLGPVLQLMDDRVVAVSCVKTGNTINNNPAVGCINMEVALCKTAEGGVIKLLRSQIARREPPLHFYSLYGTRGWLENDRHGGHQRLGRGKLYVHGEHSPKAGFEEIDCPISDTSANLPQAALKGGHGTTEYFLVRDFLEAVQANRLPPIDAVRAAEFTAPGIVAHASALQGGAWMDVPQFSW